MENQYRTFQQSLQNELSLIERAFMEERTELIESNIKEVEGLFDQRRNGESKYMEERSDKIEDHVRQLENLRVQDSEEYSMVKIKLETDVQILEQQLHQALFLLFALRIVLLTPICLDASHVPAQHRKA